MKKHHFFSPTRLLFAALSTLFFAACTLPAAYLDPSLQGQQVLPVKGRNGILLNQQISFGAYQSSKVKRGWTTTSSVNVSDRVEYENEKRKFRFKLSDDRGNASEVRMASHLTTSDLLIFGSVFRVRMDGEDIFAGSISLENSGETWDFGMVNLNKIAMFDPAKGQLTNGSQTILIEEERRLANGSKNVAGYTGFNFLLDGKVVGSVDVIDRKGKVTLSNSLSAEEQFVVANAAAALLLWEN